MLFHVMGKPIGPICNLDCAYCFYLEKEKLFPVGERFAMPDSMLEAYICQYIGSQPGPEVNFAWQGGEPTLLGVKFFERVVDLQARYANGKTIGNALQTNGTLLDDAWGAFLKKHRFLVGLSIDGPAHLHDAYRVDKRKAATFDRVMRGLDVLKRHEVDFNTLTVVHAANVEKPQELYRFLKDIGSQYLQFIPLVERVTEGGLLVPPPQACRAPAGACVAPWSVKAEAYGEFLVTIFDEWVRHDVGRVFVQLFDVALSQWMGLGSSLCIFAEECGAALALEHNGDLYACDHYVYPKYKLGTLLNKSLGELAASPAQRQFGRAKRDTLPDYCQRCEVRFACNGECPRNRFISTPDGEPGLNYLCAGYRRFFRHADPYMNVMSQLLRRQRPASDIMEMIRAREGRPPAT